MEAAAAPLIVLKRSAAQQKAAERNRIAIEKRNLEIEKLNGRKHKAGRKAEELAAAEVSRTLSLPSTPPTLPLPSTLNASASESDQGLSPDSQKSPPQRVFGNPTPATSNATSSSSSSTQHSSPFPSLKQTTMALGSTLVAQLLTTDESGLDASAKLLAMQNQYAPTTMLDAIGLKEARKMRRTAKQRQYRAAPKDTRNHLPSLKAKIAIAERSKLKKKLRREQREKGEEVRPKAQRERILAVSAAEGVVDLEAVAREQREATLAAMSGQEVVNLD